MMLLEQVRLCCNNELREKLIVHGLQDVYDKFNVRRVAAEHGELFEKEIKRRI